MKSLRQLTCFVTCVLSLLVGGVVHAGTIDIRLIGVVESVSNYGGLAVGDEIRADLSLFYPSGSMYSNFWGTGYYSSPQNGGFCAPNSYCIISTKITAGSLTFDGTMSAAPLQESKLQVSNGNLVDFDYNALFYKNGAPENFQSDLQSFSATSEVIGAFTTGTLKGSWVKVVPIPAAAWLFGSGLVAFVTFFRRK